MYSVVLVLPSISISISNEYFNVTEEVIDVHNGRLKMKG